MRLYCHVERVHAVGRPDGRVGVLMQQGKHHFGVCAVFQSEEEGTLNAARDMFVSDSASIFCVSVHTMCMCTHLLCIHYDACLCTFTRICLQESMLGVECGWKSAAMRDDALSAFVRM
jgi:hypothetical protein